jgi:hypothetical protein
MIRNCNYLNLVFAVFFLILISQGFASTDPLDGNCLIFSWKIYHWNLIKENASTWNLTLFIIENAAEVVADAVDPIANDVDDVVGYDPFVDDTTEFFLEGTILFAVNFDIAIVLRSRRR